MTLVKDPLKLEIIKRTNVQDQIIKKNDLFTPKWFVFYTYPKSEKKVEYLLTQKGYETYLPCKTIIKQWHDRKKKIQSPLFPNYIFVKTLERQLYYILEVDNICSFIKFKNKPAVIKETEIKNIRKMLELTNDVNTTNEFQCGDKVKISRGPLLGLEGIILKKNNSTRFVVRINELNQYVSVLIDSKDLNICADSI